MSAKSFLFQGSCRWRHLCALLALLQFFSASCHAAGNELSHSNDAPIEIEADSAEQNEAEGLITYRGNVFIQQADLKIVADKVSIQSAKPETGERRQLTNITASGSPAMFTHGTDNIQLGVRAEADTILFEVNKSLISLTTNAKLTQNNSSVQGDFIEYLIQQRRVRAKALNPESGDRVRTVISPENDGLLPALN